MEFRDVLLLVGVICFVLAGIGGFILWYVLRNFRFNELKREVEHVSEQVTSHIAAQAEAEREEARALKHLQDSITGAYEENRKDREYQKEISNELRQKLGIERRTAMIQRRVLERTKPPNPPKE